MRILLTILTLIFGLALAAPAADTLDAPAASAPDTAAKVTLDLRDESIKDAASEIAKQTGADIIVDPQATGKVTLTLGDIELPKALDMLTKFNNLTWMKFQFARQEESKVPIDKLEAAALTLAAVPVVGLSVSDPVSKTATVFAKNLDSAPNTAAITLPKGYTWATVYVVMPAQPDSSAAFKDAGKADVDAISKAQVQMALEMAKMTPEQREQIYQDMWSAQMDLSPEDRQAMIRDQITAISNLGPTATSQIRQDFTAAIGAARRSGP